MAISSLLWLDCVRGVMILTTEKRINGWNYKSKLQKETFCTFVTRVK